MKIGDHLAIGHALVKIGFQSSLLLCSGGSGLLAVWRRRMLSSSHSTAEDLLTPESPKAGLQRTPKPDQKSPDHHQSYYQHPVSHLIAGQHWEHPGDQHKQIESNWP